MPDLGALFDPKGIIITGVSNHPGKFGFVTLHNLLASGYEGAVYPVSREPGEVLISCGSDCHEVPAPLVPPCGGVG